MSDDSSIRHNLKAFGKLSEVCEVRTFSGYRNKKHVTVQILDRGPESSSPELRYACDVVQEDGKKAGGNEAASIGEAIGIVHWEELD